jgi:cytosine deaminase
MTVPWGTADRPVSAGRLVLVGATTPDGGRVDIAVDPTTGTISEVAPSVLPVAGDTVQACAGLVVLPAGAEPHAHLDKALSGGAAPNPAGDLLGAIQAWHAYWPRLTHDDLVARATTAIESMVLSGTTAIRSHVDVGTGVGLKAVRALLDVRDDVHARGLADLQLVALVSAPLSGDAGRDHRRLLGEAIALGVDVVGGCPHVDPDPRACTEIAVSAAEQAGLPVDLHSDETLNPTVLHVRELARLCASRGLGGRVTASHCVSLGAQPPDVQAEVAALLADAGVAVVVLPQTNLYLQARGVPTSPPRGLTAVKALTEAGVTVAAGADNVRDPFCSVGRMDPLETAALLVMTAHLTPDDAWEACSGAARRVLGFEPVRLAVGAPAELLLVEGASLTDAVAGAGPRRVVVHRGRVVAGTEVQRTLYPVGGSAVQR